MALDTPHSTPETQSQLSLIADITSMRNLLALPITSYRNIPKSQQISTYDYLLQTLDAIGVSVEAQLSSFITKIFENGSTFMEQHVFNAVADALGQNGTLLSPYTNTNNPTAAQQKMYKTQNRAYINNVIAPPINDFLAPYKQQIAKNLIIMIFGPRQGVATTILNPNQGNNIDPAPGTVNNIIQNAICGEGLYGISNTPSVTNQTLEANRIALKEQLEAGQVQYTISCQNVKISLPQNPAFIFNGGGTFTSSTSIPSPDQSLQFVVQFVNNEVQRINNETNAAKGGKTFQQNMVEKLLSYISVLVQPFIGQIFTAINNNIGPNTVKQSQYVFDNCAIAANPTNTNMAQFTQSMFDSFYKELIKELLLLSIKEFKTLISNYYTTLFIEKQKQALAKAQQQFAIFNKLGQLASKIQQEEAAISSLNPILL